VDISSAFVKKEIRTHFFNDSRFSYSRKEVFIQKERRHVIMKRSAVIWEELLLIEQILGSLSKSTKMRDSAVHAACWLRKQMLMIHYRR